MALSNNVAVNDLTKLYVSNSTVESAYESAQYYSSVFGNDRVEAMLKLKGTAQVYVNYLDTYTDEGALVIGIETTQMNMGVLEIISKYGYSISITNTVNTMLVGTHTVEYKLYLDGTLLDTVTRNVTVRVDDEAPTGTISIRPTRVIEGVKWVNTPTVVIDITANDNITSQANMQIILINEDDFESQNGDYNWQDFYTPVNWTLSNGDGSKRVYLLLKDEVGNVTGNSIYYDEVETGG